MDVYQKRIQFWAKFFALGFSLFLANYLFIKLYFLLWFYLNHYWKRPLAFIDLAFWVALPVFLALLSYGVAVQVEKSASQTRSVVKLYFYRLSWFNFISMIVVRWLNLPEIEIMLALLITIGFILIYRLYRNVEEELEEDGHDSI